MASQHPLPPKRQKAGERTIDTFFKPVNFTKNNPDQINDKDATGLSAVPRTLVEDCTRPVQTTSNQTSCSIASSVTDIADAQPSTILSSTPTCSSASAESVPNDIGEFIGQRNLSDFIKRRLLEEPWQPPKDYTFPCSLFTYKGKTYKRFLNQGHLDKFNWLVLSHSAKGLFCKYCPWFTVGYVGGGQKTVPLKKLVCEPLTQFKKLLGKDSDLTLHEQTKYHKAAVEAGKKFLDTYHNPNNDVLNQLNQHLLTEIKDNRERLKPIVETIVFLGRQKIPLRGHRDHGPLLDAGNLESSLTGNEGNFRELLRFRIAAGDTKLEEHLKQTSSRSTYISKRTQNQLIACIGQEILESILNRIRKAGEYSIIFDETTDISHKSQLSLVLRYVDKGEVVEDFVGFIDAFEDVQCAEEEFSAPVEDNCNNTRSASAATAEKNKEHEISLTGKAIGQIVLRMLKKLQLSLDMCVGIGTDGCSVMMSEVCGAVAEIQTEAKNALRTPCYNHKLNNSIQQCSKIPAIRNSVGTMKECVRFFDQSPKRNVILLKRFGGQLSGLCETRWVERHDGVIQFSVDLPKIIDALDDISKWHDSSTSSKASQLKAALTTTEFLIGMLCLSDVLTLTLPLSKLFQKSSLNLECAAREISNLMTVLSNRRQRPEIYFKVIWQRAQELAHVLDVDLKRPRTCSRQDHRANFGTSSASAEEYFKLSIFVPLYDNILMDLKDRFPLPVLEVFNLPLLLPENVLLCNVTKEQMNTLIRRFKHFFDEEERTVCLILQGELELWREKWAKEKEVGITLSSTAVLKLCDKDIYPIIHKMLHILSTLPVSNASSERSFSTLRRLKTWLRSTMSEERLCGLALMHVHRDVMVDIDRVIDRFGKSGKRRLQFNV